MGNQLDTFTRDGYIYHFLNALSNASQPWCSKLKFSIIMHLCDQIFLWKFNYLMLVKFFSNVWKQFFSNPNKRFQITTISWKFFYTSCCSFCCPKFKSVKSLDVSINRLKNDVSTTLSPTIYDIDLAFLTRSGSLL